MSALSRRAAWAVAAALVLRLLPALLAPRLTGDVARYERVARHVLDVSWNVYETKNLYPYPPLWVWIEAGSEWIARHTGLAFPILVKLPVIAADALIVARLALGAGEPAAWAYAVHPVSILITAFQGQFDAVMLLLVLLALQWHAEARFDRAALALAAAIATKSFPVLLLPLFLIAPPLEPGRRLRFATLSILPVAVLLAPFAIADPGALRRELFGYGGIADFGWIALVRGVRWLQTGALPRSEAEHWPTLVPVAKLAFLAAWAALLVLFRARRRVPPPRGVLAVFLAFLAFYGAVSAQYLLWVVPFGLLRPDRRSVLYAAAATLALLGFYAFLAPGIVFTEPPVARPLAGAVWVAGVAAVLVSTLAWLAFVVREPAA